MARPMRWSPRPGSAHLVGIVSLAFFSIIWSEKPPEAAAPDQDDVRSHAEQSFSRLPPATGAAPSHRDQGAAYPPDQYLIGTGQGDMAKGTSVCRRVSELSARTEIAKQIRILVKEHMVDRVRERNGRETDQDIELTREEIVQEYLQGVMIVNRQVDEAAHTCSATAVMSKKYLQVSPTQPDSSPALVR